KAGVAAPLFASATLTAGKTFTATLFAAGTYAYSSTAGEPTSMTGAVAVAPTAAHTRDGSGRILVTWADALLAHQAENVQWRSATLGSGTFGPWTSWKQAAGTLNWTALDSLFTP